MFVFFMFDKVVIFFPGAVASVLEYLSMTYHLDNIARGIVDTRDVVYFLSVITIFLFLAVRTLESRRWR